MASAHRSAAAAGRLNRTVLKLDGSDISPADILALLPSAADGFEYSGEEVLFVGEKAY